MRNTTVEYRGYVLHPFRRAGSSLYWIYKNNRVVTTANSLRAGRLAIDRYIGADRARVRKIRGNPSSKEKRFVVQGRGPDGQSIYYTKTGRWSANFAMAKLYNERGAKELAGLLAEHSPGIFAREISRENPSRIIPGNSAVHSEIAVMVYGRVLRIEAQKTQPHKCDPDCAAVGHRYYHDFKKGAVMYGLENGDLLIRKVR